MLNMQSCCIRGCNSYRESAEQNIGYFKFPLHDVSLLNQWLRKINWPGWKPSDTSQICSVHFKAKDVDWHPNRKHLRLLPTAVPRIFPVRRKATTKKETRNQNQVDVKSRTTTLETHRSEMSSIKINYCEPHRNKVTLLKRKPVILISGEMIPDDDAQLKTICGIKSKLRKILTKGSAACTDGEVCSSASDSQKSIIKITINKKYNAAWSSVPAPFETIYLPDHRHKEDVPDVIEVETKVPALQTNPQSSTNLNNVSTVDHSSYSKIALLNVHNKTCKPQYVRQYSNGNKLKHKDISIMPISTQSDVRSIAPQEHIYSSSSTVRVESCNSNDPQESEQLRKRLEELKKRRKCEQQKIVRLQMHLTELEKQMKENNREEIVLPSLKEGCESAGMRSSWLLREKEEYEKLLKDVREIKLRVLRQRHTRELEKIRTLQMQMTNLGRKMKENDRKEIAALSNLRQTISSAACMPDWMKREEEEYEKLLQDVRKIKQSYKLRQSKQSCAKSNTTKSALQTEKVLSDEECVLIEIMQKKNRPFRAIEDDSGLVQRIKRGINWIDDNEDCSQVIGGGKDDCGEIIGVIDEDSIDIEMSKGVPILNFNEELPDPGLLDI